MDQIHRLESRYFVEMHDVLEIPTDQNICFSRLKRPAATSRKKAVLAASNSGAKQPPNTDVSAYTRNRFIAPILTPKRGRRGGRPAGRRRYVLPRGILRGSYWRQSP